MVNKLKEGNRSEGDEVSRSSQLDELTRTTVGDDCERGKGELRASGNVIQSGTDHPLSSPS